MNLKQLLEPFYVVAGNAITGVDLIHYEARLLQSVSDLKMDHRDIRQGDVFVALQGHHQDARQFIIDAINAGAIAVFSDEGEHQDGAFSVSFWQNTPIYHFSHLKSQLSQIAAHFYHHPSQLVKTIGITGTNGKTTISQLMAQWIDFCGGKTAVMGTTGNGFMNALESTINTTGNPIQIQRQFSQFNLAKATHVAMEVSSHGLEQDRVKAVAFDAVVFSNLSRDHLDYHGTMDAYAKAKRRLFSDFNAPIAVLCADSPIAKQWLSEMPHSVAVSMSKEGVKDHQGPSLYLTFVEYSPFGVTLSFCSDWGKGTFSSKLVGQFNVMNLLLSLATLLSLGFDKDTLLAFAPKLQPVIGRMDVFRAKDKPLFVVDYAHTPDALDKALDALRLHCNGALWCVFGCGGERDTGKRALMGAIAENKADYVILTDDNPRSESPQDIVAQILQGMAQPKNAIVLHDRASACSYAFDKAKKDDVILIAGKGHEDYQVLVNGTIKYSDSDTVCRLLGVKR